jgi:hypothetical protein
MKEQVEQEDLKVLHEKIQSEIKILAESEERMNRISEMSEKLLEKLAMHMQSLDSQEKALAEIQSSANLRKRESENSVREIKNQMTEMDHDLDAKLDRLALTVIHEVTRLSENSERNNRNTADVYSYKLKILEKRMNEGEQWRFYFTLFVILLGVVLSIPDILSIIK